MKYLFTSILILAAVSAFAQNSPIPTQTFSFTDAPIALPGTKGTFAGSDMGASVAFTQNFSAAYHSIVSSDAKLSTFGGGVDYALPVISLKANNAMPNLSGFRFLFSVGGSGGLARVKDAAGNIAQHYTEEAHVSFSYALSTNGAWQLGARVGMARFPGFASGWVPVVSVPFQFHF